MQKKYIYFCIVFPSCWYFLWSLCPLKQLARRQMLNGRWSWGLASGQNQTYNFWGPTFLLKRWLCMMRKLLLAVQGAPSVKAVSSSRPERVLVDWKASISHPEYEERIFQPKWSFSQVRWLLWGVGVERGPGEEPGEEVDPCWASNSQDGSLPGALCLLQHCVSIWV